MARSRTRPGKKKAVREDFELVKMAVLARRSGVPTPTIKHYIREGLVPGPQIRTSKNMAYYDARMVERLRTIKTLQAEQYLPLRVIGEMLEPGLSAKLRPGTSGQRSRLIALAPVVTVSGTQRRRRSDVIKAGLTRAELDTLEKAGVLDLQGTGETAGYSGADLAIVDLIVEVYSQGYRNVFPISVAVDYLTEVKRFVMFEIELFRTRALDTTLPAPLPDVARQAVSFGERLLVALRGKLLPALLTNLA